MALTIYMDVHIPAAVTDGLRRSGLDVLTSQEDQTRTASDEELLSRAAALGRLLFTQDEDFLSIAAAWQRAGNRFPGILFTAQMGMSIGRIIVADRVIYLPLK